MDELIFVMCGGDGTRLKDWYSTKCLLPIPVDREKSPNKSDIILHRLKGQLARLGKLNQVVLVLGYKYQEVIEIAGGTPVIFISNPDCPRSVMTGIHDTLTHYSGIRRYTILLGDVIFSIDNLQDIFSSDKAITGIQFFGDRPEMGEMFAIRIVSDAGNDYLRKVCHDEPRLFTFFGTMYLKYKGKTYRTMDFADTRINDLYRHMQTTESCLLKKKDLPRTNDVDTQEGYEKVVSRLRNGYYA